MGAPLKDVSHRQGVSRGFAYEEIARLSQPLLQMDEMRSTAQIHALLLLVGVVANDAGAYRILGVFPHAAKSHFLVTEAIMKGLAARGHHVVVVSPFPQAEPVANYTDVSLSGELRRLVGAVPLSTAARFGGALMLHQLSDLSAEICEKTLASRQVQQLLASDEKFDLVVLESFLQDCFLAIARRFRCPFVAVSTSATMVWTNDWFGNADNPSYVPVNLLGHTDRMTFWERLVNTAFLLGTKVVYRHVFQPRMTAIVRKYFGESAPSVEEMTRNASLCLVNTHFSLNQPRPMLPSMVEVGGVHIKEPEAITKEWDQFLNDSAEGAVYFSLGSTVRMDSLPEEHRRSFAEAFAELPHKVLWKWESESLPARSPNVKIAKWMPQVEILSHRNVKAFITHGGLLGILEAAYFGVPMVAIPLFGDQHLNVRSCVEEGIAVKLDYSTISKETVLAALKTVLNNPSYAENARRVRDALRDRPMSPLDTAVYWIQYVVRHGGAPHLRSAAADLRWYQYSLLDVAAALLLAAASIVLALVACLTVALRHVSKSKAEKKKKKLI